MRALHKKLLRDLERMWAQALTIALVVACGIASYVAMHGAFDSLVGARDRYYANRRFADVFAQLERAPESVAARIAEIDGVARVHTRVVRGALLPIEGLVEPAVGRVISVPSGSEPPLCALHMRKGRAVERGRSDEVVVLEAFAAAHSLEPGSKLPVVLEGMRRDLRVVGIAVSPEFVFALGGSSVIADDKRFTALWMGRDALAPNLGMEGSFNDVLVGLQPGASERHVIEEMRRLLEPYGLVTISGRDMQASHRGLEGELSQLRQFAAIAPLIFLGVAAFLVNLVLGRILHLQRGQIATLKALGYTDGAIAMHYLQLALVVLAGGAVLGIASGMLLGRGMLGLYRPYFKFASLELAVSARTLVVAVLLSLVAGIASALGVVWRAARLRPAVAMQPEAPFVYGRSLLERTGLPRLLGLSGRMVARELSRKPLRTVLSCVGIAWATAIVIVGRFGYDAVDHFFLLQFEDAQHEDVEVAFRTAVPTSATREISHLPGVIEVQPQRAVPVRVSVGSRHREVVLVGHYPADVPLRGVAQWPPRRFTPPADGVTMSETLAKVLGAGVGDRVRLEPLEGRRRAVDVVVTGQLPDLFGLAVHASADTVNRLLGEDPLMSSVLVSVEDGRQDAFTAGAERYPAVASMARRRDVLALFQTQTRSMSITTYVLTAFGAIIAFGVVYNNARVALSIRARDLASLRVLGFTRGEISRMLLGEIAVYVAVGVPLGLPLGNILVKLVMGTVDPEMYRLPAYVSGETYAFGAVVMLVAAAASALLVRRKLDHLDLVSALKTKE